jgi:hypothetical protein
MRGLYAHASQRMRDELTADLQGRWEESLRERAAINPHSSVPLLDTLLAPFRTGPARENTISQIPPNTATAPIHIVGWELSSELLTWSFSGAPLRNRTVDLLLTMESRNWFNLVLWSK